MKQKNGYLTLFTNWLIVYFVLVANIKGETQNLPVNNTLIITGQHLYYSPGTISSPDTAGNTVQISGNANVEYKAAQYVHLKCGFKTALMSGCGVFHAYTGTAPLDCPTPIISGNHYFCPGSFANLSSSSSSGGNGSITSYQWRLNDNDISGATNAFYAASLAGDYTLILTNSIDCKVVSQIFEVHTYPSTSFTAINTSNTYTWPANGITYTNSGTYTTTLLSSTGCDSILTLYLNLSSVSLNVVLDQEISCHGMNDGSVVSILNDNSTYVYNIDWGPFNNNSGVFTGLSAGTHTVCAFNGSNITVCNSVLMTEPDPLSIIMWPDPVQICPGTTGTLNASITGGTNFLQPYLTSWYDASNTLLNPYPNIYDVSITGVTAGTYKLVVEDDHYCLDSATIIVPNGPCQSTLNLSCFIEGYWAGAGMMSPVLANQGEATSSLACDSIDVILHDQYAPYGVLASVRTVLKQDGTATAVFPPLNGDYYIAVTHRNSVETWSAIPVSIGISSNYDFTTSSTQAYGSNQVEVSPGVWAFYSGDNYKDAGESIDLLDLLSLENSSALFNFGYFPEDINGDGNVDLLDLPIVELNVSNFVYSVHP